MSVPPVLFCAVRESLELLTYLTTEYNTGVVFDVDFVCTEYTRYLTYLTLHTTTRYSYVCTYCTVCTYSYIRYATLTTPTYFYFFMGASFFYTTEEVVSLARALALALRIASTKPYVQGKASCMKYFSAIVSRSVP